MTFIIGIKEGLNINYFYKLDDAMTMNRKTTTTTHRDLYFEQKRGTLPALLTNFVM